MEDRLHFAAHSHHLWPDRVGEAQSDCIDAAFCWADEKWERAINPVEEETRSLLAYMLGLSDPNRIAFAPNTHSLFFRLVSCFDLRRPLRILSTDSEFYSFSRQALRLEEYDNIHVDRVPTLPFRDFGKRFLDRASEGGWDMIYVSQVFFNSGLAIDFMEQLAGQAPADSLVVIDGYHGCGALPTNLGAIEDRVIYLAGGYKYLQSGEGACFMTVPAAADTLRPLYTGWFAEFDALDAHEDAVNYAPDGRRFLGATFDPSGIFRLNGVLSLWRDEGIDVPLIHAHVRDLQRHFMACVDERGLFGLGLEDLLHVQQGTGSFGHFLTFRTADALSHRKRLRQLGVITDSREDRLRFGFGLYHDVEDIDRLFARL
ncbi:hypothetical protein F3N42_13475 [Marinihelvus fidelis]|uniref:Aminotransferase class V-fold PLP-dependent enzyme n=2 Tax=Marinihelvus fidelis TaxID=2613842 RepID=A0A5N0T6W1_9GAMM|nr:hypothetical protein F3N42_13475 [Marinihelvus fidelis]